MVDGMMRTFLAFFIALFSIAVIAAELPDPTRPPALLVGADDDAVPGQKSVVIRPSGLQSTIISESRRAAIIDGKTVELGAKHGNDWLVEVNEGSVVLQGAQKRRVLTLFPEVKMTQREVKTKNASPKSEAQPEEVSTMTAVQKKKHMSGHPKEKK